MAETNNYENLCAEFRRANRIVALMQGRIRDIVFYIQSQTRFADSKIMGKKLFSNEIANYNNKKGELKVQYNMWPWDFIYSYVFEYRFFFDKGNDKEPDKKGIMSIIQISDDGFLESNSRTNINKYESVENSKSWLILSYSEGNTPIPWDKKEKWQKDTFIGEKLVAKRYNLSEFYNEESINEKIEDFDNEFFDNESIKDNKSSSIFPSDKKIGLH